VAKRLTGVALAALVVFVVFVVLCGPMTAGRADAQEASVGFPHVVVWLHVAGGDAIDLYLPTRSAHGAVVVDAMARSVANAVAPGHRYALRDRLDEVGSHPAATVQFDGRIARHAGSALHFEIASPPIGEALGSVALTGYFLSVCAPTVGLAFHATRAGITAAPPSGPAPGFACRSWFSGLTARDVSTSVDIRPRGSSYGRLLVGLGATALLGCVVGALAATAFRRAVRTTVGVLVLTFAGVAVAALSLGLALLMMFVRNESAAAFVIARDLSRRDHLLASTLPAYLFLAPGLVFAWVMARTPTRMRAPVVPSSSSAFGGSTAPVAGQSTESKGPGLPSWLP
jgi:hypothetical protein